MQTRKLGFSRTELIAVVAILAVLVSLLRPFLHRAERKAARIRCVNNLKEIGLSFRMFYSTGSNGIPSQLGADPGEVTRDGGLSRISYGASSNPLVAPKLLVCPADDRPVPPGWSRLGAPNTSYFLGLPADESHPYGFLAGDRNLTTNGIPVSPGLVAVSTNAVWGWSRAMHGGVGNVALADGSVQQTTTALLQERTRALGDATRWLVVP